MIMTFKLHKKNSTLLWNMPIALWNARLEVLNSALAASKRAASTVSLAKAFAVRTPERLLSIS